MSRGGGNYTVAISNRLRHILAGFSIIEYSVCTRGTGIGDFSDRALRIDQSKMSKTHVGHGSCRSPDITRVCRPHHDYLDILQLHLLRFRLMLLLMSESVYFWLNSKPFVRLRAFPGTTKSHRCNQCSISQFERPTAPVILSFVKSTKYPA
jgi:hypothetical protein